MDILQRLEIVSDTTADGHPLVTIEYEYREAAAEIRRLRGLIAEAPKFFSHHDFDGDKLEWLGRAGLVG